MPFPLLGAAAASAGSGILAGIGKVLGPLGSLFGANRSSKKAAGLRKQEMDLQREFAQNGIRWRVADAKAAGLHPLYALGASGLPSYSPVGVQESDSIGPAASELGQNVSSSARASMTPFEQRMQELALLKAEAELQETDARIGLLRSEAARMNQMQLPPLPGPSVDEITGNVDVQRPSPEFAKTIVSVPGDEAMALGGTPLWREFRMGSRKIFLPGGISGDAAEVLESVGESLPMMWAVYRENVARQGPVWGEWFLRRYVGDWAADMSRFSRIHSTRAEELGSERRSFWKGVVKGAYQGFRDLTTPRGR